MLLDTKNYITGMTLEKGILYNGQNGTYRYADNKMYSAVIQVPTLYNGDALKEQIIGIKLPKIPYEMFTRIYEFFKHVYKVHKSEVAVLLWYNFDKDIWDVEVPKQSVGGANVAYARDEDWANEMQSNGFTCVGTIHSHCEMSAFHSGIDDHDEYNFDGVHITIGKVLSGPEFAQRFIVKQMSRKFKDISEVVDIPVDKAVSFPEEWKTRVNSSKISGRRPSLLGGGYSGGTNMRFNPDGSMRKPSDWEIEQETEEAEEEITEEEKKRGSSYNYIVDKDVYECPLCLEQIPPNQLGKDYTCPYCGFPLYADEADYIIEYESNPNGVAMKDVEEMDIDDLMEKSTPRHLSDYL